MPAGRCTQAANGIEYIPESDPMTCHSQIDIEDGYYSLCPYHSGIAVVKTLRKKETGLRDK